MIYKNRVQPTIKNKPLHEKQSIFVVADKDCFHIYSYRTATIVDSFDLILFGLWDKRGKEFVQCFSPFM